MFKTKKLFRSLFFLFFTSIILFSVNVQALPSDRAQLVVNLAKQQLGKPYVYGAAGPNSFDCSGLVYYCYKNSIGVTLPRTSQEQATQGKPISINNLEPGDLIFPYDNNGHVGIYIGNNQVIYAPQTGDVVKIQTLVSTAHARRIEGWFYDGQGYLFLQGGSAVNGWVSTNGKWYYLDDYSKHMLTDWQKLNWSGGTSWFYFDKNDGHMLTDWQQLKWSGGTNWFYFDKTNGNMLTGWQQLKWSGGTNWFYFTSDGVMVTNQYVDGYYIDSNGVSNR